MAKRKKRPTVWQALNDPVVEVNQRLAQILIIIAIIFLMLAWVAPYWDEARQISSLKTAKVFTWDSALLQPAVAGAETSAVPVWYEVAREVPGGVASEFRSAAYEVLDISEPIGLVADFYEPGLTAATDAWLDLMADPY